MKKLFTIVLAVIMMMATATSAFAAAGSETSNGGETSFSVNARYSDSVGCPTVVSVKVEWGVMEFTYSVGGTWDWDATTHTYTNNEVAHWSADGNTVSVTNHSNVDVDVEFNYEPVSGNSLVGSFAFDKTANNNKVALSAGELNNPNGADRVVATLTLSGTLAESVTESTQVGTVTVKITY